MTQMNTNYNLSQLLSKNQLYQIQVPEKVKERAEMKVRMSDQYHLFPIMLWQGEEEASWEEWVQAKLYTIW